MRLRKPAEIPGRLGRRSSEGGRMRGGRGSGAREGRGKLARGLERNVGTRMRCLRPPLLAP
jgi:hypothetical protein